MAVINDVLNAVFSALLFPFTLMSPFWGLIIISSVAGVILLIVWGKTSNQDAIKKAKEKIAAHLLEVRIYNEDLGIVGRAMGSIFKWLAIYQRYVLKPLLVVLVPVTLIIIQLNFRYGYSIPEPSDELYIKAVLKDNAPAQAVDIALEVPEGLTLTTPGVRVAQNSDKKPEVSWMLKVDQPGSYSLKFTDPVSKQSVEKILVAEGNLPTVSPLRATSFLDQLLYPIEDPIPTESHLESLEVRLQPSEMPINWLILFLIASLVAGFALKGIFKVEI